MRISDGRLESLLDQLAAVMADPRRRYLVTTPGCWLEMMIINEHSRFVS